MYRKNTMHKTSIKANTSYQGMSIEEKIRQIKNNKEPIEAQAPMIYTDRKDGVIAQYDIRADKFEHAAEAGNLIATAHRDAPKIKNELAEEAKKNMEIEKNNENKSGGAESTQATD